jgi:hypothetical protein
MPETVKLKAYSKAKGAKKGSSTFVKIIGGALIYFLASDPAVHAQIVGLIGTTLPPAFAAVVLAALAGGLGTVILNRMKFYGQSLMRGD